jgi:hypothetical protein
MRDGPQDHENKCARKVAHQAAALNASPTQDWLSATSHRSTPRGMVGTEYLSKYQAGRMEIELSELDRIRARPNIRCCTIQ